MLKKILIISGGILIVGVLAAGALIRTTAVLARQNGETLNGNASPAGLHNGWGNAQAYHQGYPNHDTPKAFGNGQQNGNGNGNGNANGQGARGVQDGSGPIETREWVTLNGSVSAVDSYSMTFQTADSSTIEIAPRAWRYAQEQGFSVNAGDSVSVQGFYDEDGEFEAAVITNLASGQSVTLRDQNGRPLWAGGRRGGS
ncbi:MAG: hypothetical protein HPY45_16885 [Anaerolineae bacterium]|nr:hypothetical protein [Anaerolineae bacterium]